MLHRIIIPTIVLSMTLLVAQTRAQNATTPEQQSAQDQMQQMRQQMFQNMQQKGIDPREFFGQIRTDIENGTLDPADVQQRMIDKGIMDKAMVAQMQTAFQSTALNEIKRQLEATDAEWKVLQPKIQKVLTTTAAVQQTGQAGMMASIMGGASSNSGVTKALRDLRVAVKEPNTSPETIANRLQAWRDAHEKAKADLVAAQKELTDLLTVRQEGVLMMMGTLQ